MGYNAAARSDADGRNSGDEHDHDFGWDYDYDGGGGCVDDFGRGSESCASGRGCGCESDYGGFGYPVCMDSVHGRYRAYHGCVKYNGLAASYPDFQGFWHCGYQLRLHSQLVSCSCYFTASCSILAELWFIVGPR